MVRSVFSMRIFILRHLYKEFFDSGVKKLLVEMTQDEDAHREDAANHSCGREFKIWDFLVKKGCGLAVLAALKA